jgi:hypothetical protein
MDTRNFHIGNSEAEAEIGLAPIKLVDVWEDYLNVIPQLNREKFIITGPKGSGKTAIAEHIMSQSGPNHFCVFVKQNDIAIQKIAQIGVEQTNDTNITTQVLFEWVILVKILTLLCKNELLYKMEGYESLQKFLKKNTGFVEISANQITSVIQTKGFDIDIEFLKRFIKTRLKRDLEIRGDKAPFYRLIPSLKETVLSLLQQDIKNGNRYRIIFDDLDVGFSFKDPKSLSTLLELIRISRSYNNDLFARNGIDTKIIVLMRKDIALAISQVDTDGGKIIRDYEIPLYWFNQDEFRQDENNTALKKFINKRIEKNFDINNYALSTDDPWTEFVLDTGTNQTTFKWLLDHTFYKPRDLILLLKPISNVPYQIPLNQSVLDTLLKRYAVAAMIEIRGELNATFSQDEFDKLIKCLKSLQGQRTASIPAFSKKAFSYAFKDCHLGMSDDEVLIKLFDYGLVGNVDTTYTTPRYFFKHRENVNISQAINFDLEFTLHKIFTLM